MAPLRLMRRFVLLSVALLLLLFISACGRTSERTEAGSANSQDTHETNSEAVEQIPLDLETVSSVLAHVQDLSPEKRKEVLLQGAEKTGKPINFFTTTDEKDLQTLQDAFHRDFPTIRLEAQRGDGDDAVYTRAVNEFRAKTYSIDVLGIKFYYSYNFELEGMLAEYTPPNANDFPAGVLDPNGLWLGQYVLPISLTWNTDLIAAEDTPSTWHDLTRTEYENKFSLDLNDALILYYLRKTSGEEEGTRLMEQIAANKPHMIRGRSQQMALLQAGEFSMNAAQYEQNAVSSIDKGAPIDFKYLEGPVLVDIQGLMLMDRAPHPYGAVLFMDWLASPNAQQVVADVGRVAAHPGVRYKNERQGVVLKERDLFRLDIGDYGPVREKTTADFNRIFNLTQ